MNNIGQKVMQGLIDGMKSKQGALDTTGKDLAKVVLDAVKKQFGIHSPSKEMRKLGDLAGDGWIIGIQEKTRESIRAMQEMVNLPDVASSLPRLGSANLMSEESLSEEAEYTIVVEATLDGQKVGEGCAKFVKQKNDAVERRERRKRGKT